MKKNAVFTGFFIHDDGTTGSTSFTVQPTQQTLQSIFGQSIYENCIVLVNVPSFYLGMNGLLNGSLGENTNYLTIAAGSYRLGGSKNSPYDRIFRNLVPQPLDGSPLSIIAGYDSVNSVVRPITVNSSGSIDVDVTVNANVLGTALTGQVLITVTGSSVQGPNIPAVNGVVVIAHPLNSALTSTIGGVVGTSSSLTNSVAGTGSGAFFQPGASLGFAVQNANQLWFNGIAGDKFSFAAS